MIPATSIQQLLSAYTENRSNPEVLEALRHLSEQEGKEEEFREALVQLMALQEQDPLVIDEQHYNKLFQAIMAVDRPELQVAKPSEELSHKPSDKPLTPVVSMRKHRWWWAAAAVLIIIAGVAVWMGMADGSKTDLVSKPDLIDVKPGKAGAVLILADGSKVVLDSLKDGLVANQSGVKVVLANGQLTYSKTGQAATDITYNTMSTPRGRQFQLLLPDGSKVWLNAASSLRYPTAFAGAERTVEITGEAYFEVAENKKMPFVVKANNGMQIKVLGTHFNINAYEEEPVIRTSLLSGSIQASAITANGAIQETIKVKPGEQVQSKQGGPLIPVDDVDMTRVMAWKNGLFNFEGLHLREAMRQLARWYDLEVVYEQDVPDAVFGGKMQMDITLAQLLKVLEDAEVNFRLEAGNRLVILKK